MYIPPIKEIKKFKIKPENQNLEEHINPEDNDPIITYLNSLPKCPNRMSHVQEHQNIAGTKFYTTYVPAPIVNIDENEKRLIEKIRKKEIDKLNETINNNEKEDKDKKFRCAAKNFAITYSRCSIPKEEIFKFLMSKIGEKKIKSIEIGQESHEEDKKEPLHLHIKLELFYTYNCKDERWLDYFSIEKEKNYHPNIQGCKNRKAWSNYIKKNDLNPLIWGTNEPYPEPEGFLRKKNDYDAWIQYQEHNKLKDWKGPITMYGITTNIGIKKRHLWIVGDPDIGKSETIETTFEGYKIYKPQKQSDYRFDNYEGENIIIYNDIIPKLEELIDVSDVYKTKTPVYGKTRYHPRYWPLKQERIIIVITNIPPIYENNEAFKSRFILIDKRTAGCKNHNHQYENQTIKKIIEYEK